jgi:hypothetical protein
MSNGSLKDLVSDHSAVPKNYEVLPPRTKLGSKLGNLLNIY